MDRPIEICQFKTEAEKRKFKLSGRTGKQYKVCWYNKKPGWGKHRGWGIFELKEEVSAN